MRKLQTVSPDVHPVHVLEIDPREVEYKMPRWKELVWEYTPGSIRNGSWDEEAVPFEESDLYVGFRQRFVDDLPWEETAYYDRIVNELDQVTWRGATSEREVLARLQKYDRLYTEIGTNGYRSQASLRRTGGVTRLKPAKFCEVLVNVGRDGQYILDDGRHRFTIAYLLGIDQIPVCVLVRHQKSIDRQ